MFLFHFISIYFEKENQHAKNSTSTSYNCIEFAIQSHWVYIIKAVLLQCKLLSFTHIFQSSLAKKQLISHLKSRYFTPKCCTFIRLFPLLFHLNTSFYKTKAMLLPHFLFLFSHKTNPRVKQNQQKHLFIRQFLSFKSNIHQ